ncbi:hypothetical protein U2S04_003017 [Escherichia coli]|uniref:hypothetical protein n=1 Tax=Escherichia coli TaxID=562 RepID=UPI000B427495|nr:hypothetical protein [Escherichia coli]EKD5786643.1 hypothetical protein [Escherichia coli]EMA3285131.1 hypothetical protein [Escherichia coli]OWE57276.1 hypothetical protein A8M63_08960 [Escherichia coli]RCO80415.1 hypothetical protein BEA16_13040 [Escherichia coli]UGH74446.1 hypothetical protein LQT17_01315 [Escherichia coli]
MDKLEINDQFAVILFEDKTGDAWCKKVTGAEARLILGMASELNDGELPAVPVEPVHIYGRSNDNENN